MLFQNNSIIAILGFVAFCTHCHIGLFFIMLPTMFLYLYKRHIIKIFFHLGAMGLTYVHIFETFINKSFIGYDTMGSIVVVFVIATYILFIPHLLFCIYATIFNYKHFKPLSIKDKFRLCVKSFFAGLVLTSIGACMVEFTAKMDFLYSHNEAIQIIKLLEFALTVFANISLLTYITYKDIKIYLAKKKER
mgnify:CR=1 FL=1